MESLHIYRKELEQHTFYKHLINIPGPWEGPAIQYAKSSHQYLVGCL